MSFKEVEQSVISKRFVSEAELEDIKRKREEEWELAKQQGRKIGEDPFSFLLYCSIILYN